MRRPAKEMVDEIVGEGRVKVHRFNPSGREIWTVVGSRGDQLVIESQPYCTCRHFHFTVLGGRDRTCYHLSAVKKAKQVSKFVTIEINDAEYGRFLAMLASDVPPDLV